MPVALTVRFYARTALQEPQLHVIIVDKESGEKTLNGILLTLYVHTATNIVIPPAKIVEDLFTTTMQGILMTVTIRIAGIALKN
jgi:hypothetical protein